MFDRLKRRRELRRQRAQQETEAIWLEMQRIYSLQAAILGYPAYDPEVHRLR